MSNWYPQKFSQGLIDKLVREVLELCEIKVFDYFYKDIGITDGLYIQCPITKDYQIWIGVCQNCCEDHADCKKFVKTGKQQMVEVPNSTEFGVIDQAYFLQRIGQQMSSTLNVLAKNLNEQHIQMNSNEISQFVESKGKEFYQTLNEILSTTNVDKAYKNVIKNNPNNNNKRILKSLCTTDNKMYQWFGYCGKCKLNQKHKYLISFEGQSPSIAFEDHTDLKVINIVQLKQQLVDFLQNQALSPLIWRIYEKGVMQRNENTGYEQQLQLKQNELNPLIVKCKEIMSQSEQIKLQMEENKHKLKNSKQQLHELKGVMVETMYKTIIQPENLYDVEIDCESLLKLAAGQGWGVKTNREYEQQKNNNTVVVSFYGLYNKGKSFLASKLSGKQLNIGYSIQTVGLSAIYPKDIANENSIVFLDTAGTETPIPYHKQVEEQYAAIIDDLPEGSKRRIVYEAKLKDRLLTENLLQKFILSQSNLILIIVDQLTKEEQKLIQKIKINYIQSEIIIVHNFQKLVSEDQVNKYLTIDILNSFQNIEPQYRNLDDNIQGYVYVEERTDNYGQRLSGITHVVMAQDDSAAGKKYNSLCYSYLKNRMLAITDVKKFDVIKKLMETIKLEIPHLIDTTPDKLNTYKLEIRQLEPQKESQIQYNHIITCDLYCATLKSISFDLLGDLKYQGDSAPKYAITFDKKQNPTKLILEAEVPGFYQPIQSDIDKKLQKYFIECPITKCKLFEWHGFREDKHQYISIRGVITHNHAQHLLKQVEQEIQEKPKDKNKQEQLSEKVIKEKEFRLVTIINPLQCVLKDTKPKLTASNGVLRLEYALQKQYQIIGDF